MRNPFRKKSMDKKQFQHQNDDDVYSVISVSSSVPVQSPPYLASDSNIVSEYQVIQPQNPINNSYARNNYQQPTHHPYEGQGGLSRRALEQQLNDNQNLNGLQELGNFKLNESDAIALLRGGITQKIVNNFNEGESQSIGNFESCNELAQSSTRTTPSDGQESRIQLEVNAIGNRNLKGKQRGGNVRAAGLPSKGRFIVNANDNYNEGELQDTGNININFGAR